MKTYGDFLDRQQFDPIVNGKKPIIVKRPFYDLGFSEQYKIPLWTTYRITPGRTQKKFHRDGKPIVVDKSCGAFCADPKITESPAQSAYGVSGFDTGHMIPAEAMQFDRDALADTFYTSNACPQTRELNRGPWRTLEKNIFKAAERGMTLVVLAGPILSNTVSFLSSGVAIPESFFKIVIAPDEKKYDCWIMENDTSPQIERPALQDIAHKTGLHFPALSSSDFWHIQGFLNNSHPQMSRSISGIRIENLLNGEYVLLEDYIWNTYDAQYNYPELCIPKGFTTDFGSIPGIVQNIYPPIGTFRDPSFLGHDWLYATEFYAWKEQAYKYIPEASSNRAECDMRLLESLKGWDDSWFSRNTIWSAVKVGGGSVWRKHSNDIIKANRGLLVA